MMWQPMPRPTSWPSSERVEMLWGQPEQNAAVRAGGAARCRTNRWRRARDSMRARRAAGSRSAGSRAASDPSDGVAVDRPGVRDERAPVGVDLAHDERLLGSAVEGLLDLGLDERRLVLDHQHLFEPGGEAAEISAVERPRHGDLDEPQSEVMAGFGVQTHVFQRP